MACQLTEVIVYVDRCIDTEAKENYHLLIVVARARGRKSSGPQELGAARARGRKSSGPQELGAARARGRKSSGPQELGAARARGRKSSGPPASHRFPGGYFMRD
ncbi:hypothetical protein Bbelb_373750 [Branchiostoma belcheri]|nr:hypothetical protein Bbelb_373750 [Branchiostoma belcheri]